LIDRPADIALLGKSNSPFDGVELYRRIRKRVDMSVVFLSAWALEIPEKLRRRKLPAADGYIQCPFSIRELMSTVKMVLNECSEARRPL
jgi:DNA-binding response OmpR family regulator